jgi:hypothetical protein
LGAWFPAGALHDPLRDVSPTQGSGRYPGSRLKCIAFPGTDFPNKENQRKSTQWRV